VIKAKIMGFWLDASITQMKNNTSRLWNTLLWFDNWLYQK
jgi:hypothetical protein